MDRDARGGAIVFFGARACWRAVKSLREIWRGTVTPNHRTAMADLIWRVPMFAGACLLGLGFTIGLYQPEPGTGIDLAFTVVVRSGGAAVVLGVLLLPLAWTVRVFAWPRMLVPLAHRGEPGAFVVSVALRAERKRRKEAGIAPTDHLVEFYHVTSSTSDYAPYWVAVCADGGRGWMEFPDSDVIGIEQLA